MKQPGLARILQKLDAALQEADADVERIDTDYKNAKRLYWHSTGAN